MATPRKIARLSGSRSSRSTRLLLWGLVVYAGFNLGHLALQEYRLLYQGHILRAASTAADEQARSLQARIDRAKTPEGIERLARKNLGMARPGEQPVRFLPADSNRNM